MRPESVIPDKIATPYPIIGEGEIINGFGRGSSEIGFPTANIPVTSDLNKLAPGIYFGYAKVSSNNDKDEETRTRANGSKVEFNQGRLLTNSEMCVFQMVMSIGYNPFYNNDTKTAEIYIMHEFGSNFYGAVIKYAVLGYVRPELDYVSKEALIEDIKIDVKVASSTLASGDYKAARTLLH